MKKVLAVSVLSGALLACGGELSEEDARVAWAATQANLSKAQSGNPNALTATVTYEVSCVQAGTMKVEGSVDGDSSQQTLAATFDLGVDFEDCENDDIVANGELDYSCEVATQDQSGSFSCTYQGALDFSGAVSGSCEIDIVSTATFSNFSYSYTYEGTVCGHDASATLTVTE